MYVVNGYDIKANAQLYRAWLPGANLSGMCLNGANLEQAELAGANLADCRLIGANLSGADLRGANLSGARLRGANLEGAFLAGASFCVADLGEVNGKGAYAVRCMFQGCYFKGSDWEGANFTQSEFHDAFLEDCNFRNTILKLVQAEGVADAGWNINGADTAGMIHEKTPYVQGATNGVPLDAALATR